MSSLITIDLSKGKDMSANDIRQTLALLECAMAHGETVEEELTHYHSYGVYAREMKIKKGWLVMGKIHKFKTINFLLEGEVDVISPTEGFQHYKAPATIVAEPGAKRLFYAHSDTTWTVCLGTHETDIDKIELEFIALDYDEVKL